MNRKRIIRWSLAVAGVSAAVGFSLAPSFGASAATGVTAKTYIANHQDGGHGSPSTWAYDDFTRTLTVTAATNSTCTSTAGLGAFVPVTDQCYTANLADNGKFNAVTGAGAPAGTGGQISHAVQGTMAGSYDLTLFAPATDALSASNVPGYRNDNFTTPATSTTNWPSLAFADPSKVVIAGGDYTWTYTSTCEKWVDSSANGDGTVNAGNITGQDVCVVSVTGPGLIKGTGSGKCLNITDGIYDTGGTTNQYTCGAMWHGKVGGAQQFEYAQRNNGTGFLLAISPDNGSKWYVTSSVKGGQLTLKPYYTGNADVMFSGGYYKFVNTGLMADVSRYSKVNGGIVQGWTVNVPATTNQLWSLP